MAKTETHTKETTKTGRTLKKLNTDIIKMEVGDEVEGKYIGTSTAPWNEVDTKTGEVIEKELTRVFFEREDGSKFLLFQDGGLKNALANAMVKEGDFIVIEKMPQVDIGKGRKSNQYDIYQYAD
jgi:hypothetical protein